MTTPPKSELPDEVANLVYRGRELSESISYMNGELETIKTRLRELGHGSYGHAGREIMTVGEPGRTWSEAKARQVLTPEQLALITVPTIDSKLAERVLPPVIYDQCKDATRKPSVSFK